MKLYFQHEGPHGLEKEFKFSGGEMQVCLSDEAQAAIRGNLHATVLAHLRSSDDIMSLLLFTDAVRRVNPRIKMNLIIPYLPYARQDRVMNPGEALSVRVMADVINLMRYDEVIFHDPHSEVGVACVNNGVNWPVQFIIGGFHREEEHNALSTQIKDMTLIAPDAGAMKKVMNVAKEFECESVVTCEKVRDTKTGEITQTRVHDLEKVTDKDVLIIDDICDGGRTFIEIAKVLGDKPKSISLYVTHGIFSKGLQPLFDAGISTVYTTDSFPQEHEYDAESGQLYVLDL